MSAVLVANNPYSVLRDQEYPEQHSRADADGGRVVNRKVMICLFGDSHYTFLGDTHFPISDRLGVQIGHEPGATSSRGFTQFRSVITMLNHHWQTAQCLY